MKGQYVAKSKKLPWKWPVFLFFAKSLNDNDLNVQTSFFYFFHTDYSIFYKKNQQVIIFLRIPYGTEALPFDIKKIMCYPDIHTMKKDTHPTYYPDAMLKCACGKVHHIGSTKKKTEIEICAHCHPFYTGKEKLIDTAGRVEKFRAKQSKAKSKRK